MEENAAGCPIKALKEDEEETQKKVIESLATAKELSMNAAVAAV